MAAVFNVFYALPSASELRSRPNVSPGSFFGAGMGRAAEYTTLAST
ncbi:hypothetical protein [Streptomyces sp. NPDC051219]